MFAEVAVRHEAIGVGRTGPSVHFGRFARTIAKFLHELSEEAGLGGKNLEAAVNDIDAQDEASQRALDSIINDIENYTKRND